MNPPDILMGRERDDKTVWSRYLGVAAVWSIYLGVAAGCDTTIWPRGGIYLSHHLENDHDNAIRKVYS